MPIVAAVIGVAYLIAGIVNFVIDIARGQDGWSYAMLGAIGGFVYVAAVTVLRLRR